MTLASEVIALLRSRSGNPDFVQISDELQAACEVIERWIKTRPMPPRYAEGVLPQRSVGTRGKGQREE